MANNDSFINIDKVDANETFECPNCGAKVSISNKTCEYCGTINPKYKEDRNNILSFNDSNGNKTVVSTKKRNYNLGIFILLLIVFWPAALIYYFMS